MSCIKQSYGGDESPADRSCRARSPLAGCIPSAGCDGGNAAGVTAELCGLAAGKSRQLELAQRMALSTACHC